MLKLAKIKGGDVVVVGDGVTSRPVCAPAHLRVLQADIAAAGGDPAVLEKDTWDEVYDIVGRPRSAPAPMPVGAVPVEENLGALVDRLVRLAGTAAERAGGRGRPAALQTRRAA
jgi:hypothetical protein